MTDRLLPAFLGLCVLAIPAFAVSCIAARRGERGRTQRTLRSLAVVAAFVFAGAWVAATDVHNDRLLNPAFYGAWFIAAAVPCAAGVALPKGDERKASVLIMTSMAALPFGLFLAGFGGVALAWFKKTTGIPTSW